MAAFAAAGLAPRVVQEGESDSVMLSLVSAGGGVSPVISVAAGAGRRAWCCAR
jgi:hypothetical protein